MKKQKLKPSSMLNPVPVVMVSCKDGDRENILAIAWAGTVNSDPPMISISVRKERYSYDIIKKSGVFAVNMVSAKLAETADFCGVRSGRDVDKFAEKNIEKFYGETGVPMVAESPLTLECKVKEVIELGSHDMFIAEITNVYVDEKIIDKDGKIDFKKAELVAYCHGEYFKLGRREGFFGFSVASEEVLKRRMNKK
jgi:flavin reductase (DIM6/NTAB) family NADH-FMN oxidoreductase RutF